MADFERWNDELLTHGQVRLRTQQSKNLWVLLGCLAFTAVGIFAANQGAWLVAVLAVGFFGVIGIPAIGYQLVRPRDVLVTPIEVRVARVVVPWVEVTGVELAALMGQQMVLLRLTEEGAATVDAQLGAWTRRLQATNTKLLGGPAVALPVQLGGDKHELRAWLALVHHRALTPPGDAPFESLEKPHDPDPDSGGTGTTLDPGDDTRFMPPGLRPPGG